MVSFFAKVSAFVAAALFFGSASAAPTGATDLVQRKTNAAAAVQDAPHFVVYTDAWISGETGPPDVSLLKVRSSRTYIVPLVAYKISSLHFNRVSTRTSLASG